jgi:hypothetical protein
MTSKLSEGRVSGLSMCYTQKLSKIAAVHKTAWRFGHEDLVKTKYFVKLEKKAMTKLCIPCKIF